MSSMAVDCLVPNMTSPIAMPAASPRYSQIYKQYQPVFSILENTLILKYPSNYIIETNVNIFKKNPFTVNIQ